MAVIDLSFVLVGTTIPLDHGYSLFSALCRIVPELHGDRRIGVHPIRGRQSAPGVLSLTERSRLKVRLPAEGLAPYIAIAGQELDLEGHRLRVGIPRVEALVPAANLAARMVTFHHAMDPAAFEADVRRELAQDGDRRDAAAHPREAPEIPRPADSPRRPGQGTPDSWLPPACGRSDCRGVHPAPAGGARRAEADGVRAYDTISKHARMSADVRSS